MHGFVKHVYSFICGWYVLSAVMPLPGLAEVEF